MKKTKMLKKNYEFKKVLTKGKKYKEKNIEAFILKNKEKFNLLGLAVSSKSAGAVTRNKIKRILRENYKNLEENIKVGYSIVFLVKNNKKLEKNDIKFEDIKNEMKNIFFNSQILDI